MEAIETIQGTLQDLAKRRKIIKASVIGIALLVLAGGLLGFVAHQVTLGVVFLVVALVLYFAFTRRQNIAYGRVYALALVRFGVCAKLQKVAVEEKGTLSREEFLALRMFPLFGGENSLMCRNTFTAEHRGLPLRGTEVTFHYPYPDAKGKTQFRFASGALLRANGTAAAEKGDWLLLRRGFLEDAALRDLMNTNDYHQVGLNQEELKDRYLLFSRVADCNAMEQGLELQLNKLCETSPWISAVRLEGQSAALFMNRRFYAGSRRTNTDPNAEDLRKNTLPEREDILALFRTWFGVR